MADRKTHPDRLYQGRLSLIRLPSTTPIVPVNKVFVQRDCGIDRQDQEEQTMREAKLWRTFTLRLKESELEQLRLISEEKGIPMALVLRMMINEQFDKQIKVCRDETAST